MIQCLTKIMLLHCHSSVLDQINPSIFKRENTGARDFLSLELPDWGLFTVTINIDEQLRKWLVYFSVPGPGSDVTGSQPSAHSGYLCIWTWVNRLRRSIKLLLVKLSPARRCFPSSVLRSPQQNGEILCFYHKDKDWWTPLTSRVNVISAVEAPLERNVSRYFCPFPDGVTLITMQ